MKKNIFKFLTVLVTFYSILSCVDDRDPVLSSDSTSAAFKSAPTGTYTVTEANLTNVFDTFVITPPTYNIATQTVYQLEAAEAGTDFANPTNLGTTTSDTYIKITYNQINTAALSLGASNGVPFAIDVRIKSNIKNTTTYLYSSPVTFTVVPYVFGPVYTYTDLYLIGNATAGGWDNLANNNNIYPLQKSSSNNVYTYSGYFAAGGFKLIKTKGSWTEQFGSGGSGVLSTDGGSGNISISTAGYYTLTIDTTALTYSLNAMTAPTTTYTYISIIGSVYGNWDSDIDLTVSTFDPHVWVAKNVVLNAGEFKFRADHDWGTNWGAGSEFFGVGTQNGSNIPLSTSFTYDVYFNDSTGEYTLIPVY